MVISIIGKMLRFCKETGKLSKIVWNDTRTKKGESAEIRIATIGFPEGDTGPWFADLIAEQTQKKVVFSWYKPCLVLSSLFGSAWLLKAALSKLRQPSVFFSGENIRTLKKYREYREYFGGLPTLAMGFDYIDQENYRRVPLWLLYIFPANFVARATVADIQEKLDWIEKQSLLPKNKFAAMIASHEGYCSRRKIDGAAPMVSRAEIAKALQKIDHVHCPGKLLHNDDSLLHVYDDDKKKYLRQFRFNICSENAASPGYVTEKLFESFEAGAIPVYWGDDNPEPAILNHERIVFWQADSENSEALRNIEKLYRSEDSRRQFLATPIFKKEAAVEIHGYFEILRGGLGLLLRDKIGSQ